MKPFCWPYYGVSFSHFCPADLQTGEYTPSQISLKWILGSLEVSTIVPGTYTIAELEDNLVAFTKEGEIDETILRKCLEIALSSKGREKLGELTVHKGIAKTRIDVAGYAGRALKHGPMTL